MKRQHVLREPGSNHDDNNHILAFIVRQDLP